MASVLDFPYAEVVTATPESALRIDAISQSHLAVTVCHHRAMASGSGVRMSWWAVPPKVRARVEEILGDRIVEARSQPGGFSPGSADRVLTEGGSRAFVKTGSLAANPDTPGILRMEAAITAELPSWVPAPRFIGAFDEVDWVGLVLEDVEGRHPQTPWLVEELEGVLDALHAMTRSPVPTLQLGDASDAITGFSRCWVRLAATDATLPEMPEGLGDWVRDRMAEFGRAATQAATDVAGDRLLHLDTRADNVLFRPDGSAVLVDWPWAVRGAGWLDALTLLINVRYFDPTFDVESVIDGHPVFADMSRDAANRVLISMAGFFTEASTRPPAPGIPTLRDFQLDQAVATLVWLRERLGA